MSKIGTSVRFEAERSEILFCIIRIAEGRELPTKTPLGQLPGARAIIDMVDPHELDKLEEDDSILSVGLYPKEWIKHRTNK